MQYGGRQTGSSFISGSTTDRNTVPTAKPIILRSGNLLNSSPITYDIILSLKYNMAAAKPEVVLSRVLQQIETQFQRLNPLF
jgi:hypothetical protein